MLNASTSSWQALKTAYHCWRHLSRYERIFRKIFKISSTHRITLNIHSWSQKQINPHCLHICCHSASYLFQNFRIKRLSKKRTHRPCRTVMVYLPLFPRFQIGCLKLLCDTHTARTVCQYNRRNTITFQCVCCFPCRSRYRFRTGSNHRIVLILHTPACTTAKIRQLCSIKLCGKFFHWHSARSHIIQLPFFLFHIPYCFVRHNRLIAGICRICNHLFIAIGWTRIQRFRYLHSQKNRYILPYSFILSVS